MASPRVVAAMSGGVDSSVAAALLVRDGCEVIGAHLRLWPAGHAADCECPGCSRTLATAQGARAVAEALRIPFEVIDLRDAFRCEVIEPFVASYHQGQTPNPCCICNEKIKFGRLMDWATAQGAEALATGHYVRVARNPSTARFELHRPRDRHKDQTYYLHRLSQAQLARFRAPIGDFVKDEVRQIARDLQLPVAGKAESQDICFVPGNDYRAFLALQGNPDDEIALAGDVVDGEGRVLGRHKGIHHFTIGQRRGIGVSAPQPLYVIGLDAARRTVIVGEERYLMAAALETARVSWSAISGIASPIEARVQIRYRHTAAPATLIPIGDGGKVRVEFRAPQRAITPGQAAVFYDETNEVLLGGAWIVGATA